MAKIKKLGVWSLGGYVALIALIAALLNLGATALIGSLATSYPAVMNVLYWNTTLTQLALVAVLAFITWVIIALVYNAIASWLGGLRIELSEQKK